MAVMLQGPPRCSAPYAFCIGAAAVVRVLRCCKTKRGQGPLGEHQAMPAQVGAQLVWGSPVRGRTPLAIRGRPRRRGGHRHAWARSKLASARPAAKMRRSHTRASGSLPSLCLADGLRLNVPRRAMLGPGEVEPPTVSVLRRRRVFPRSRSGLQRVRGSKRTRRGPLASLVPACQGGMAAVS
jgi:hypothetical protein